MCPKTSSSVTMLMLLGNLQVLSSSVFCFPVRGTSLYNDISRAQEQNNNAMMLHRGSNFNA